MSNGDSGLEFLRFGSSIPGNYWGCCACCIIQNFKVDPDAKMSIQIVSGDGGGPVMSAGSMLFAGPTYRDIFHQRLRIGTFGTQDMPNHAFIAILTQNQIDTDPGRKWLPILKEAGFEFVRTVSNSVYGGPQTAKPGTFGDLAMNHIFMLVRNIGKGAVKNPYIPPKAWTDLPEVVYEGWHDVTEDLVKNVQAKQLEIWDRIGPCVLLKEEEVVAAGAPVVLAGLRSEYHRPQTKESRMARDTAAGKVATVSLKGEASPVVDEFLADGDYYDGEYQGECGDPDCEICGYPH